MTKLNITVCMGSSCFARGNQENLAFLEDYIKEHGINANIDGTGTCVTDSQGKCFGYCNAGSVTIAVSGNNYADIGYNTQQIQTEAT